MPAIVRWPGKVPAGVCKSDHHLIILYCTNFLIPFNSTQVTTANIATTYDIFPTSLALAGYPLPDDRIYDGQDLSDVGELIEPHIMGRLDVNYRYYIW